MAEAELGDGFDVRAFHDEVLGSGAVPLRVLETNIREWVDGVQAASVGGDAKSNTSP